MKNFYNYNLQKMKKLKEQMAIAEADKYFGGNNAAEARLNKALEQIQTTAQLLRNGISDKKNAH